VSCILNASRFSPLILLAASSELSEPQKLLPYLLQSEIANLHPEIIAVYIQATSKIFGHWAAEVAQRWDDGDLPEVKNLVDLIIVRVREFVSNAHVEVQERVRHNASKSST
jgi:AP-3 complex subunit delta-1